jgi:hypothetical protein
MAAGAPILNAAAAVAVVIPAFFKNVRLSMIPPLKFIRVVWDFFVYYLYSIIIKCITCLTHQEQAGCFQHMV